MVKINALQIENTKRIRAVALTPAASGLTIIGGRNGQGKTSVLDAIAWALGGKRFTPSSPARDGSVVPPYLRVELSNGLVVERRGKNSELRVTDPTGQRAGQTLLDSFVSAFALDLPRFLDAGDKDKADILLGIIGVKDQLAKLDLEIRKVYDERHSLGRIADQKKKFAQELPYWEGMPAEPISASELIRRQQEILARNGENQRKRAKAAQLEAQAKALQSRVTALSEQLQQLADQYDACLRDLQIANTDAAELQDESTAELEESLRTIEQQNAKIRQNLDRQRAVAEAEQYEQQYADCTRQLAGLRQDRLDLLQGADLPLPGLSVNESGQLTYQDKAWDCMSGAQQLMAATSIVRRVNPQCGFVLLDKLEQMDPDTLAQFGAWLEQEGLQAIATRVSTGSECSIIIEDGYAAQDSASPAPARNNWKAGEF